MDKKEIITELDKVYNSLIELNRQAKRLFTDNDQTSFFKSDLWAATMQLTQLIIDLKEQ